MGHALSHLTDRAVAGRAADFGERVHPRTRAGGGARKMRILLQQDEADCGRGRSERSERSLSEVRCLTAASAEEFLLVRCRVPFLPPLRAIAASNRCVQSLRSIAHAGGIFRGHLQVRMLDPGRRAFSGGMHFCPPESLPPHCSRVQGIRPLPGGRFNTPPESVSGDRH